MTDEMVAADFSEAKPNRRRVVRRDERTFRVRLACEALVAEGKPFRYADVAARAEMAHSTLFRYPELHDMVEQARQRAAETAAAASVWKSTLPERNPGPAGDADPATPDALDGATLPAAGEMSVAELAGVYLSGRVARGELQANSARVAQERLAGLVDLCGPLAPSALTRPMLVRWQETVGHLAPSTRRHYISQVRRFCAWLAVEGFVAADPAVTLAMPREPRRAPRALGRKDVVALEKTAAGAARAPWAAPVVALMVGCGLRCVEISRLDLADYDDAKLTVTVRGKGGHQRVLPVPRSAAKALRRYIAERGPAAGPLFKAGGSKGSPDGRLSARWISRRTGQLLAQAGVHTPGDGRSAHALRHTAASDVLDRCHDVRIVQQMLGHESLATTQIYLRSADLGALREAMSGRDYSKAARKAKKKKASRTKAGARP